jgi:hypothetical protein
MCIEQGSHALTLIASGNKIIAHAGFYLSFYLVTRQRACLSGPNNEFLFATIEQDI